MKLSLDPLWQSMRRGVVTLCRRKAFVVMMTIVPLVSIAVFLSLLNDGVVRRVPSGVVDLDHSSMSRSVTRSLGAIEFVDVTSHLNSYVEAMDCMNRGEIFGFFMIPENFEADAIGGRQPEISYYCNMSYYVPGTFVFKGFKTVAVSTAGAMVKTTLVSAGMNEGAVGTMIQPVVITQHPIHNPWLNYSYYLNPSFIAAMLQLIIFVMTGYTIGDEIKKGTSVEWVRTAGGSMLVAIIGKLFPQWVIFSVWGVFLESMMFGYLDFPMYGNMWNMITAMLLFVLACQSFGVLIMCALPNLRLGASVLSLIGILSFSLTGFSFPVENMYSWLGVFSWFIPVRYYFLIYINDALNGFPVYYARYFYIALLLFPLAGMIFLRRLRKVCLKPYYIP
ncbi:MAG: ABC transporter permease [Pseudoflavonifractor sp.]|nr:ABC transporter permease [Pseudoflavonifractor sp.]